MLNIFFLGEVSCGKSSLLNAIAGGIISNVSLQRETIKPEMYSFLERMPNRKKVLYLSQVAAALEVKHVENKTTVVQSIDPCTKIVPAAFDGKHILFESTQNFPFNITDFPGINDTTDENNAFAKMIEHNIESCDMIVFVTKAENAFLSASEMKSFCNIKELVEKRLREYGQYIKLCIVVNKFDDLTDVDLNEIYNDIPKKIKCDTPIFRISSHKMFVDTIIKKAVNVPVPAFLINETQKILQTSNVMLCKAQKMSIRNDRYIRHDLLEYNEIIAVSDDSNDPNEKSRNMYSGDWDGFQAFIAEEKLVMYRNKIESVTSWAKCYTQKMDKEQLSCDTDISLVKAKLELLWNRLKLCNKNDLFCELVANSIFFRLKKKCEPMKIFEAAKKIFFDDLTMLKKMGFCVMNKLEIEGNYKTFDIIYLTYELLCCNLFTISWLKYVLSISDTWKKCSKYGYDFKNDEIGNLWETQVVVRMIETLPKKSFLRKAIQLSLCTRDEICILVHTGSIDWDLIREYLGNVAVMNLIYYVANPVFSMPPLFSKKPEIMKINETRLFELVDDEQSYEQE